MPAKAENALPASTVEPSERSDAAERMRRYRERRRRRLRCITIDVKESEIDALIQMELLPTEMRNDNVAVAEAIHRFLDVTLSRQ